MALKLTKEEELALVKEYQTTGDMRAFKKLRSSLKPLMYGVIRNQKPAGSEMTDTQLLMRLHSHLPDLLKKYDPKFSQLNTYLIDNMTQLTRNAVSENKLGAHVPRPEHTNKYRYSEAKRKAEQEFGFNPTPEQILQMDPRLKSVDEVKRISQYDRKTMIGDIKFSGEDGGNGVDFKDQFLAFGGSEKEQMHGLQIDKMRELQRELPDDEAAIIEEYIFKEKSLMATALSLGETSSRVRKVLDKWKLTMKEKGLDRL